MLRQALSQYFKSTVWCFSFVSLFNLQGTRRISGTLFSISEAIRFVKNFFQVFSNFFVSSFTLAVLVDSSVRIPHHPHLVNTFFHFFSSFFHKHFTPYYIYKFVSLCHQIGASRVIYLNSLSFNLSQIFYVFPLAFFSARFHNVRYGFDRFRHRVF